MIARQKLRDEARGDDLQDHEMQDAVPQNKNTSNLNLNPTIVEGEPQPCLNPTAESSVSVGASAVLGYLLPCLKAANKYFPPFTVSRSINENLGTQWSDFTNDLEWHYDLADSHFARERFRDAFRMYYHAIWDIVQHHTHQRSLSDDEALQFLLLGIIGCCKTCRGKSEIKFTLLCLDHATHALSLHISGDTEVQTILNTLKFYQAELAGLTPQSSKPIPLRPIPLRPIPFTPLPEPSADTASLSTDTRSFLRSARRAKHDMALRQATTKESAFASTGAKYQFSSTMSTSTHGSWQFHLGVTKFPDERKDPRHVSGDDDRDSLNSDYMREQNELLRSEMGHWSLDRYSPDTFT